MNGRDFSGSGLDPFTLRYLRANGSIPNLMAVTVSVGIPFWPLCGPSRNAEHSGMHSPTTVSATAIKLRVASLKSPPFVLRYRSMNGRDFSGSGLDPFALRYLRANGSSL
jgi:hypothetical protein